MRFLLHKHLHHCLLLLFFLLFLGGLHLQAQEDDLLKLVGDSMPKKTIVKNAFKSTRVIMGQSMEFLAPGALDFRILHRFGEVNEGIEEFFGLDQASTRLGLDYGITQNLMIGIGRSTYRKEVDGFIKYALVRQATGEKAFPVTVALIAGMTINTSSWSNPLEEENFWGRSGYYLQGIVGRKFSDRFTVQVTPTWVNATLLPMEGEVENVFAAGLGGRWKFSKRMALTWDYFFRFNDRDREGFYDPFSVGLDIETGGHVFQLHFSNAVGMNERAFINETTGQWGEGEIRFGFNISRVFQLKKKKIN